MTRAPKWEHGGYSGPRGQVAEAAMGRAMHPSSGAGLTGLLYSQMRNPGGTQKHFVITHSACERHKQAFRFLVWACVHEMDMSGRLQGNPK